jgi:hypothetical protein
MSRSLFEQSRADRKGPVALSLAIHAVVIVLIASITFRYPISALFNSEHLPPAERIQYVQVTRGAPAAPAGNGSETKSLPKKAPKPAPLLAPSMIPSALPPIAPPTATSGAISGTATGTGGAPAGMATGVEPALPDPRIELRPNGLRIPISTAQRNDSAVKAIYMAYREAEIAAEANRGRSPRDWTMERNGQKYGLDSQYIYLGKFKLPSAILAALPFNFGGVDGTRIIEGRNAQWIQNDIYTHAQGMSEDDFNAAIRRIRERKDREKKEQDDKDKGAKAQPIVP